MTLSQRLYLALADLVLVIHFAFVAFVVIGLIVIWIGKWRGWGFVRNLWFRAAHLAAMGVVAFESVTGIVCPLTTWENELRLRAGDGGRYAGSFVQHWLHRMMFFDCGEKTFMVIYLVFFLVVALTFWRVPPRWPGRRT